MILGAFAKKIMVFFVQVSHPRLVSIPYLIFFLHQPPSVVIIGVHCAAGSLRPESGSSGEAERLAINELFRVEIFAGEEIFCLSYLC